MELSVVSIILIVPLFFVVAFLYSSVGHGGASGYLAVLSFFAASSLEMSTTALLLNIIVAGIASVTFMRAHHFSSKLAFPFIISSIPMAFLGGMLNISRTLYGLLLAFVLALAAIRLAIEFDSTRGNEQEISSPQIPVALFAGAVIGLLSGIVGVGGGIFLSPLIMLMRWGTAKQTAAVSAVFIVVNSIAGILGRSLNHSLAVGNLLPFLLVTIIGGYIGSRFGAQRFSNLVLRRLLAIVLVIAAAKLFLIAK